MVFKIETRKTDIEIEIGAVHLVYDNTDLNKKRISKIAEAFQEKAKTVETPEELAVFVKESYDAVFNKGDYEALFEQTPNSEYLMGYFLKAIDYITQQINESPDDLKTLVNKYSKA
jgi:hypothetical protein